MPEPIPVNLYECPLCGKRIEGNLEQAREHTNMPVDEPLPLGLVYFDSRHAVTDINFSVIVEDWGISYFHTRDYKAGTCFNVFDRVNYSGHGITSKEFRENLIQGNIRLLTPEELSEFKKLHEGIEQGLELNLIRTTPELEALVKEKSKE